jgi:hypothetical protein
LTNLWVTYAWQDNDEGDFDYLVQRLEDHGVEARYDKIQIVPGFRLWEQIAERILSPDTDGWASLVTPISMASEPCREELSYALSRALDENENFPLIGLLHGVSAREAPPALYARLCVNLSDRNWPTQVRAGLEQRAPLETPRRQWPFTVHLHHPFQGNLEFAAIEVSQRLESLYHWRLGVPVETEIVFYGDGPRGTGPSGQMTHHLGKTPMTVHGIEVCIVGALGPVTSTLSAWLVVRAAEIPQRFFYGFYDPQTDQLSGNLFALEGVELTNYLPRINASADDRGGG